MPSPELFQKIRSIRQDLKQHHDYGDLIAERYLMSEGDLIGQWFVFEKADIKWLFDSETVEVWVDHELQTRFPVGSSWAAGQPATDLAVDRKAA